VLLVLLVTLPWGAVVAAPQAATAMMMQTSRHASGLAAVAVAVAVVAVAGRRAG
jgi:hypothetical protein